MINNDASKILKERDEKGMLKEKDCRDVIFLLNLQDFVPVLGLLPCYPWRICNFNKVGQGNCWPCDAFRQLVAFCWNSSSYGFLYYRVKNTHLCSSFCSYLPHPVVWWSFCTSMAMGSHGSPKTIKDTTRVTVYFFLHFICCNDS